jgi:hypothetical protein
MLRTLVMGAFAGFLVLGAPALARAADHGEHGEHGGRGDHDAPEPLTTLGLMLGAGGVAVARWAANRKSRAR